MEMLVAYISVLFIPIFFGVLVYGFLTIDQEKKCESWIEIRLYRALKKKGYKAKCQKWCWGYRIDISLPKHRLAIECDGKDFHSSPAQKKYDAKRTHFLNSCGWEVIRFTGSQINTNPYRCVAEIEKKIKNKSMVI